MGRSATGQAKPAGAAAGRLGPRPLPLHLLTLATTLLGSRLALPLLSAGWRPSNPPLTEPADGFLTQLGQTDPQAFAAAVEAEARRRFDSFMRGVQAYRVHPHRRQASESPVVWSQGTTRLLGPGGDGPPVLLVPSLINRAYVLDLAPRRSLVGYLAGHGFAPYLVDWGSPGVAEATFSLTDYIAGRLEPALDAAVGAAGRPAVVVGYCMGGLLALALALRRPHQVAGLALLATPWDFRAEGCAHAALVRALAAPLALTIDCAGELPVDVLQALFATIDPGLVERKFRAFAEMPRGSARARDFVAVEDWLNDGVPLVEAVARECLFGWYGENTPANGAWAVGGEAVRPERLEAPALVLVPERDRIVPPASAQRLADALPGARRRVVPAGHIGMVVGRRAVSQVYRPLARWMTSCCTAT